MAGGRAGCRSRPQPSRGPAARRGAGDPRDRGGAPLPRGSRADRDAWSVTAKKGDTSVSTDGESVTGRHEAGVGERRADIEVSRSPEKWSVTYEEGVEVGGKAKAGIPTKTPLITAEGEVGAGVEIGVSAPAGTDPRDLDPRRMEDAPEGTVFTVEVGADRSGKVQAGWKGLMAGESHSDAVDKIAAIEKLDGDKVQITRGDKELMANQGFVGLGADPLNVQAGVTTDTVEMSTESVTLDLSTPEGRAAYERYLESGEWPEASGDGVSETTNLKTYDWERGTTGSVTVGGLTVDSSSTVERVNGTTETFPDGTQQDVRVFSEADGASLEHNTRLDPQGNPLPLGDSHQTTYTYEFTADASTADVLSEQTGQTIQEGETVRISLSQAEMEQISGDTNPGQRSLDLLNGEGTYQEIQRARAEAGLDPLGDYGSVEVV